MPPTKRNSNEWLRSSSSKKLKSKKNQPIDFISQLQALRDLGFNTLSDQDLHSCLKLSGYNVQIAAERLITGQFQEAKSSSNESICTASELSMAQSQPAVESDGNNSSLPTKIHAPTNPNFFSVKYKKGPGHDYSIAKQPNTSLPYVVDLSAKEQSLYYDPNPSLAQAEPKQLFQEKENGLLLCQRWIVGFSTTRGGMIRHNEFLQISTASLTQKNSSILKKGSNITRFKGNRIEGTLDSKLSNILSPLMRAQSTFTDETDDGPLIQVLARGLMEDRMLNIGSEVPLELSVTILRPQAFFSLFEDKDQGMVSTKSSQYFGQRQQKVGATSANSKAAFDLLQWAHYGNLPLFEVPLEEEKKDKEDDSNFKVTLNSEIDLSEEEDLDNVVVIEDESTSLLAQEICNTNTSTEALPEEDDPIMLNKKGIELRSYQRQGLRWMMDREKSANTKESSAYREQMKLLADLASSYRSTKARGVCTYTKTNEGVECEVGPVLVSDGFAESAKTLDGAIDPVVHPLWERRFLWDRSKGNNAGAVYSFYVNELLQTASKFSPRPPKEACGGILADAMGLGKTVICISLIAKDVECPHKYHFTDSKLKYEFTDDVICLDDDDEEISANQSGGFRGPTTTLVVAPLSLISQWEEEIKSKSTLSCLSYYGDQSKKITPSQVAATNVLITTYGMIQSCFSTERRHDDTTNLLLKHNFRRVILDEAHLVKNSNTGASKACCSIKAERRWAITGTPISNSLQDLYGLMKFLHHEPWCEMSFWKKAIRDSSTSIDQIDGEIAVERATAIDRLKQVLTPLLLRRTKDTVIDGKTILTLPPVDNKTVTVDFDDEERLFYNALLNKSLSVFDGFIKAGTASKSWFQIFSLLQRLRQACDHLALTVKSRLDDDDIITENRDESINVNIQTELSNVDITNDFFLNELLNSVNRNSSSIDFTLSQNYSQAVVDNLTQCIRNNEELGEECAICLESLKIDDLAVTSCSHVFCRSCLVNMIESTKDKSATCPMCSTILTRNNTVLTQKNPVLQNEPTKLPPKMQTAFDAKFILRSALQGKRSSKMNAVFQEMDSIWQMDPGSKILIFSQYLGMFDLLQTELDKLGISYFRLDGKMSLNERRNTLNDFGNFKTNCEIIMDPSVIQRGVVLMASMKACGVGMNLVAASSVFILDPWWNDAMESQCVARIQRIGQRAPIVRVRKFVVNDSGKS